MPWGSFEGVTYSVSASVNSDKKGCTVLFYKNIFLYIASLSLSQPDLQAGFFICWFLSPIFPKISRRLFSQQLYTAYKSQNIYKIFADPLCLWTNWIGPEINIKGSGIIIPWIICYTKLSAIMKRKKSNGKNRCSFITFVLQSPKHHWRKYIPSLRYSSFDDIGGGGESRTHVLLGCQKTFYILSLSFFLKNRNADKHALRFAGSWIIPTNTSRFLRDFSVSLTPHPRPTDKSGATFVIK